MRPEGGPWVRVGVVWVGPHGVSDEAGNLRPTETIAEIAHSSMLRRDQEDARDFREWDKEMDS